MPIRLPTRWTFRLLPFVAALLITALGVTLGQWQTRRGDQKQAIAGQLAQRQAEAPVALGPALLQPDGLEYRRVRIVGRFEPEWTLYLDNRPHGGIAGFYVFTPVRIDGGDTYVLIARGWLPRDNQDRSKLPVLRTPSEKVVIEGHLRLHPGRSMQLGQQAPLAPGAIVQNLDVAELAAASHLTLQAFIVEQTSDTVDGLVRDWASPALGIEMHRGYAFQWYALSVMAVLFFIFTGFRRGNK